MTDEKSRVDVFLCSDLGESGSIDLDQVSGSLLVSDTDIRVEVVANLCNRPDEAIELASGLGAERLVLGICSRVSAAHEFQGWVRKAGLDPYAFELVNLNRWIQADRSSQVVADAVLLLKAAVDRLKAFDGSDPEQLKMKILYEERKLSRRALVSLPPWAYEAVPSIRTDTCLGHDQCGLCLDACPVDAIEKVSGRLTVNKLECKTCGICQAACPVGAFDFPGSSLRQYEAELSTLLSDRGCGLVLACRRASEALDGDNSVSPLPPGWLPVEVPCMAAVTPGWLLQALAGGAASIALLGCGKYCKMEQGQVVEDRVDYVQKMLEALGVDNPAERVKRVPADSQRLATVLENAPVLEALGTASQSNGLLLTEPAATAAAVVELADVTSAAEDLSLTHDASPLGLVKVREETCTTCGSCASFCPTGALAIAHEDNSIALTYDSAICVNCGRCTPVCPEADKDTISVSGTTDLAAVAERRISLKEETFSRCVKCGQPVAPASMLNKVQSMLEATQGSEALVKSLSELCGDCRASSL